MSIDTRIPALEQQLHLKNQQIAEANRQLHAAQQELKAARAKAEMDLYHAHNRQNDLYAALRELVTRCDGAEGVQPDGSNMDTTDAHAALGDFNEQVLA